MATVPPPAPPPVPPEEPSNRWPWVALLLGVLIVGVAVLFFFLNRPRSTVITVEGTPTVNPVARAGTASPGPPPTLAPPAPPTSAPLPPTPTAVPATATPIPPPTAPPTPPPPPPPSPTPLPAPPAAAPAPAAPPPAAPAQGETGPAASPVAPTGAAPVPPQAAPPPAQPAPPPAQAAPAAPPTPLAQVANAGGAGNTRADFDSAYGAPVGETPGHLVVYRKNNFEYHVRFVPDPSGRAALIVEQPQQSGQTLTLDQAVAEARKLLPKDAQPPNPRQEGNDQFVVERFTSQSLAQALPPEAFGSAAPGSLMAVYVRDSQGRITRIIVGAGADPQALINAAAN